MISTVGRGLRQVWDVLVGSDPGLLRLRLGARAVLALVLIIGAESLLAPHLSVPTVVAILLGGIIAMNGSLAAASRSRTDVAVTLGFFPLAAGAGALAGCLVKGHRLVDLTVFVAVMVVAAFVRRYGSRGFQYGMIAWLSYFFTSFAGFGIDQFGDVMVIIVSATGCVAVCALWLLPDRPQDAYLLARRAFQIRVAALAGATEEALAGKLDAGRVRSVLHARSFRVVEAALIVDGQVAMLADMDDGWTPAAIRHGLLDVELAVEGLASAGATLALLDGLPPTLHADLRTALAALRDSDPSGARAPIRAVHRHAAQLPDSLPRTLTRAVEECSAALDQLLRGLEQCRGAGAAIALPAHLRAFSPAVTLVQGNLPTTSSTAAAVVAGGASWWSRRSLNTRLCLQVAVAGTLAVMAGDLLSGRRYYWAVLACFFALTGTFTTGETAVKGVNRVIGTSAGLLAATVTVHLTGHNDAAIVAVVLVCVFLGLYFFRVSYAVMAFAVTTVMGQLYNVLHEFSDRLLALRVAETALGAAIGAGVALVLLPVRVADARDSATDAFLAELTIAVTQLRQRLATGVRESDLLLAARRVDARLHQLALVLLPAGGQALVGLSSRRVSRRLIPFTEAAYSLRALALAVGAWSLRGGPEREPRRGQELALRVAPLLDALSPLRAEQGIDRVTAVLGTVGDELALLRRELGAASSAGVGTSVADVNPKRPRPGCGP